jgi:hypothetical protein
MRRNSSPVFVSPGAFTSAPKPIEVPRPRCEMILSRPEKAPPHDLQELLLRVLAPALRRHARHRALHDLEERLLYPLARDVAGDRGVVGLARDLVDLVDVDDAALRPLDVVVGRLQQLEDDILDVLADIAGLGQGGRVGHREGNVEDARQGLREQGLAAAGRADQQDVGLGELDVIALGAVGESLVVVVHRHRQHALGVVLADHVVVEDGADVDRGGHAVAGLDEVVLVLLADDVHAQLDALVADEHGGPRNQLAHDVRRQDEATSTIDLAAPP